MVEWLGDVPDPRCSRKKPHELAEIFVCVIMGLLAGKTKLRRIVRWCRSHLEELQKYMPFPNGIPSLATMSRILAAVDGEMVSLALINWTGEIFSTKGIHIAIDGKGLRAAAHKVRDERTPYIINAADTVSRLVIAQLSIGEKTNEAATIPALMDLMGIDGSVVTIDAAGATENIMEAVCNNGGDFVLQVKKNCPALYQELMALFDGLAAEQGADEKAFHSKYGASYSEVKTFGKNRERYEYRECQSYSDADGMKALREERPHIACVGRSKQVRILQVQDSKRSKYVITIINKIPVMTAKKRNYKTVLEQETIAGNILKFLEPEAPVNAFENEKTNSKLSVIKSILGILAVIFGGVFLWCVLWSQGILGGNKYVRFVKEACPEAYPNVSYGEAFGGFFGNCKWEYFRSEDNQDVVEFSGNCMYDDKTAVVKAQFLVSYDEGKGELYTMSINDEIQPELVQAMLLAKIFGGYGSGADTNTLELEEELPDDFDEEGSEKTDKGISDQKIGEDTGGQIHRYELLLNDMTWTQAYNDCISRGGYLVQINSLEEYKHIIQQINGASMQDVHFYLGGRRSRSGRDYYWINSQNEFESDSLNPGKDSWAAGHWMKNEPSYSSDGDTEQYMSLVYYQNEWVLNDVPEDISVYYPGTTGYICEYDEAEPEKTDSKGSGIVLTPQPGGKSAASTSSLDFPILFQGYLEYSPCPVMVQDESGDVLRSGSYSEMLASCVDDGKTMYASPFYNNNQIMLPTRWDAPNDMWYDGLLSYDQFLFVVEWIAEEHDSNGVSKLSTSADWEDVSNLSGRWNDGKRDISINVYSDWGSGQAYQEIANWICEDDKGSIYLLGKSDRGVFVVCEAENGAWMVLRYNGDLVVDSVNGFDVEKGTKFSCLEHFVS